jgi:ESCRT-II complex subunit VPS25
LHSEQPNAATQAAFTEQWTRLLLAYARHRGLFILRIEDAEVTGSSEWDEVLKNPRINRGSSFLFVIPILDQVRRGVTRLA